MTVEHSAPRPPRAQPSGTLPPVSSRSARTQTFAGSLFCSSPKENLPVFSAVCTLCALFPRSFANVQVLTPVFSSAHALFVKNTREGGTPKSIQPGIKRLATHCAAMYSQERPSHLKCVQTALPVTAAREPERKSPVRGVARQARLRIVAVSAVERKSPVRGAFAVSKSGLLVTAWAIAYNLGFFGPGNSHSCGHFHEHSYGHSQRDS